MFQRRQNDLKSNFSLGVEHPAEKQVHDIGVQTDAPPSIILKEIAVGTEEIDDREMAADETFLDDQHFHTLHPLDIVKHMHAAGLPTQYDDTPTYQNGANLESAKFLKQVLKQNNSQYTTTYAMQFKNYWI